MALSLSQKVATLCPDLMNKNDWQGVRIEDDGSGAKIVAWSHSKYSQPSDSAIAAVTESDFKAAIDTHKWDRAEEYPDIRDQLDALYRDIMAGKVNSTGDFAVAIKAVKDKYPKRSG